MVCYFLCRFHSNLVNEAEDKEFWEVVREFCERIFMIPAPPPGSLSLVRCYCYFNCNGGINGGIFFKVL